MMQPGVILFKEQTDDSQGVPQILSNISACLEIVDSVKTTLGPRGMDKLMVDSSGSTIISNDGATIINKLDVVHPAAKILVDIAQSQDEEVGDGTTSVVLLAGELLKNAKPFIENGIDTRIIASAYEHACLKAVEHIRKVQVDMNNSKETLDEILIKCAETSMNSKLISSHKTMFARMVVDTVKHLSENLPLNMIGIKKVSGGTMQDSKLIFGVAFKKAFSYAGFEMQPKSYKTPKIALLNIELELKAEKENAEIRISSIDEYQKIVDAEWQILYDKLEKITQSGAKVVLSKLPIGDVATQYFADRDIFCAGRIADQDMSRTLKACGGSVQSVLPETIPEHFLGKCDLFEEVQIGNERYNVFSGCPNSRTCTFILRGCGEQYLDEVDRSLHDAIMIVRRTIKKSAIVAGGGAIEMHLSKYLRDLSFKIEGKKQLLTLAYAKALEVIPRQLCLNAGFDVPTIVNPLRHKHSKDEKWYGVDLQNESIADNYKANVWEPAMSKINSLISATEAACLILTVDETITAKRPEQ